MEPDNPVLRKFVAALNAGDREAFFAVLTPTATMSDDGSERDLAEWTEREIFASNGHMEVESESVDGLSLVANYLNSTWGQDAHQMAIRTVRRSDHSIRDRPSVRANRVRAAIPRIPAAPAPGPVQPPRHGLAYR
jgi:hypothetical protein